MIPVSVVLISFNQKAFISAAVNSLLSQDHSPLQIVISDDGSTDGTYETIESIAGAYKGPHEVVLLPKTSNAGLIGNLNRGLSHTTGELVLAAAGDDISHPRRASTLANVFLLNNRPMLIHTKARVIDANGVLTGREEPPTRLRMSMSCEQASRELSIYLGATAAWGRNLLDAFPPIHERDAFEDLVMGFRASLYDSVLYHDEALVDYRVGNGISQQKPENMEDYVKRRKRMLRVNVAVYRQRLKDLEQATHAPRHLYSTVLALRQSEEGRLAFYQKTDKPGEQTQTETANLNWRFISGWLDELRKHLKNKLIYRFKSRH